MRVGVVGCGHWGKNYVRVLDQLPGVSVPLASDLEVANRRFVSERFHRVVATDDTDALLRSPELDAVVIATPAASHHDLAARAIEHGKHLIVEKPLALDAGDCERLTAAAEARGLVLLVSHTFLYNDSIHAIKELLRQEESGDVYYLTARRNHLGLIRHDVGVLWDLAAHDVAVFSWLLDREPEAVCAVGGSFLRDDKEDVAFVTLFYPGGSLGHIQASWVDASKVREMVVITSRRRIVFDDLDNLESVRVFNKGISIERDVESFGEFQFRLRDGDILSPRVERREPLRTLCEHFVDCVRGGRKPLSDGHNGTAVVRVLAAAARSMAEGGRRVLL